MKRIAFVITGLETGGAEMMLYRLVSRLSSGFQPHVLSLSGVGTVGAKIRDLGICVEGMEFGTNIPNPFRLVTLMRRLRKIRPHIVQTWLYHADLLGTIAARAANVPIVSWNVRCSELDPRETPVTTRLVLKALARMSRIPDAIVVNSHEGMRVHQRLGYRPKRWEVIQNGFDTEVFRPDSERRARARAELGVKEGDAVFGMLARYHAMKDHATLIRALAILAEDRSNVHLVLVGTGVTVGNESLDRLIQDLGVENKVHLLGEQQDIAGIMTGLDCLVLSSAWGEGFPNVVAEAMACGVPCIVTDVGDAKAIVGNAGWVVPPRSPQSLASAMRGFLHLSPSERIDFGLKARERVAQEYALDLVVGKYEALFDSL